MFGDSITIVPTKFLTCYGKLPIKIFPLVTVFHLFLLTPPFVHGVLVVSEFGTCLSSEPSHSVQDSVVSVQNPDTQSRTQSSQSRTETGPQLRYNIHSLDKSHRDFCRSISKTYERSIFSKTSTGHIYYVSHNDFCTDLKII